MKSATIYLRREQQNGKVTYSEHWVWDANLFLNSQQAAQRDLAKDGKDWEIISMATREEYRAFAWPNQSNAETLKG